jgi:hypothetical protein
LLFDNTSIFSFALDKNASKRNKITSKTTDSKQQHCQRCLLSKLPGKITQMNITFPLSRIPGNGNLLTFSVAMFL